MELMEPLTEEQQDEIYAEVGYKREQLDQDVKQIREWLAQQLHLPPSRLKETDSFLKTYLTGCKGSLEKVKKKLDDYYIFRSTTAVLENRDPLEDLYATKTKFMSSFILPRLYKSKELVFLFVMNDPDTKNYHCLSYCKKILQVLELQMRHPSVIANTYHFICDLKNFTAGHFVHIPLTIVRDMLQLLQNVFPFRLKTIIIINMPSILEVAMNNLVKPFLSQKLSNRFLIFSGGFEELCTVFDRSIFPKDIGGDYPKTVEEINECWVKKEVSEREWFINELSEHTDESKRIIVDGVIPQDSYFGAHGSLKKLIVD